MKRTILLVIVILLQLGAYCQSTDKLIGKYYLTEICTDEARVYFDTTDYNINIAKYSDDQILLLNYNMFDTIHANIRSDSIYIPLQTFYYNQSMYWDIIGSGEIIGDTIWFQYRTGGPMGLFDCDCKGIKEIGSNSGLRTNRKDLNYYPNPFSDNVKVDLEIPQTISKSVFNVYNGQGVCIKKIYIQNRGEFNQKLDLVELPNGIYFLELRNDSKLISFKKMIKH